MPLVCKFVVSDLPRDSQLDESLSDKLVLHLNFYRLKLVPFFFGYNLTFMKAILLVQCNMETPPPPPASSKSSVNLIYRESLIARVRKDIRFFKCRFFPKEPIDRTIANFEINSKTDAIALNDR